MSRLRIKFIINKGRHGAPMAKLGKISEQAEKFLRALASEVNIETRPGEWLAANFKNGSVEYDAEFQGDVNPGAAQAFVSHMEFLADYDPEVGGLNGIVSTGTALEYARIGTLIDPDEQIGIGIYPVRGDTPKLRSITYHRSASIKREIETPLPAYGSVQGILHAWFKEHREPYFQMRELSTDALIKVLYPPSMYADVVKAVQERTTMLIASGNMLFDRASRVPIEMRAERLDRVEMLSTAEFESFFGSAPDLWVEMDDSDVAE